MKKYICILILSSAFAGSLYAQQNVEDDVKVIRELYQKAQDFIKHDVDDPTVEYQLTMTLQRLYPIGGPQTQHYDFYFDWENDKNGNRVPRLKFIRMKSTTGGLHNEEFLFNEKGEFVFYFSKFDYFVDMDNDEVEMRLYYNYGSCIRNLLKTKAHGTGKITELTTLPEDYQHIADYVPREATRLWNLFQRAMDNPLWEMMVN